MSQTSPLPKQFLKNLKQTFSEEQVTQILSGLSTRRPTTFRVNTLKSTIDEVKQQLDNANINYHQLDFPENAFILLSDKKEFIETNVYKEGIIYIQSLASMLPPLILDPKPTDTVLDLTAAPGSKTTQLAALMGNSGKILANDRHLIRLEKLKYNLKKQGVTNTEVTSIHGQELGEKYPNTFDKTLLDAPCSLEGTFQIDYPKTFQNWSQDLVEALSQRQKDLLYASYKATKKGGIIVYSTCTLSPQENEEVINDLVEKVKDKVTIEKIDLPIPNAIPGFIPDTIRILPSQFYEGFFIAKLKKIS